MPSEISYDEVAAECDRSVLIPGLAWEAVDFGPHVSFLLIFRVCIFGIDLRWFGCSLIIMDNPRVISDEMDRAVVTLEMQN